MVLLLAALGLADAAKPRDQVTCTGGGGGIWSERISFVSPEWLAEREAQLAAAEMREPQPIATNVGAVLVEVSRDSPDTDGTHLTLAFQFEGVQELTRRPFPIQMPNLEELPPGEVWKWRGMWVFFLPQRGIGVHVIDSAQARRCTAYVAMDGHVLTPTQAERLWKRGGR